MTLNENSLITRKPPSRVVYNKILEEKLSLCSFVDGQFCIVWYLRSVNNTIESFQKKISLNNFPLFLTIWKWYKFLTENHYVCFDFVDDYSFDQMSDIYLNEPVFVLILFLSQVVFISVDDKKPKDQQIRNSPFSLNKTVQTRYISQPYVVLGSNLI